MIREINADSESEAGERCITKILFSGNQINTLRCAIMLKLYILLAEFAKY
jgi:hypothetical protein